MRRKEIYITVGRTILRLIKLMAHMGGSVITKFVFTKRMIKGSRDSAFRKNKILEAKKCKLGLDEAGMILSGRRPQEILHIFNKRSRNAQYVFRWISLLLPLLLSNITLAQSPTGRIPLIAHSELYPFPDLPPEAQIFSTQSFCQATHNTCMNTFRDCLRVVGGIPGANQACEQWRDRICEHGIREGCDQLPPENGGGREEEDITSIESTTATVLLTTEEIITPTPTSVILTVTITNTLLRPTTLFSIYTMLITEQSTVTKTQTITNSDNSVVTNTWTMTIEITSVVERGLTFAVSEAWRVETIGTCKWWVVFVVWVIGCI